MQTDHGFGREEMGLFSQALEVAEENVSDHFRLSHGFWQRHPFEVRTLADLDPEEVSSQALAQVLRLRQPGGERGIRAKDFFRICFQDHNFLKLIKREKANERFLPLLTYVMVHELVHVVRFYKFMQLFDAEEKQRASEEAKVHRISADILEQVKLPHLGWVLKCYEDHAAAHPAEGYC